MLLRLPALIITLAAILGLSSGVMGFDFLKRKNVEREKIRNYEKLGVEDGYLDGWRTICRPHVPIHYWGNMWDSKEYAINYTKSFRQGILLGQRGCFDAHTMPKKEKESKPY